MPAIFPSSCKVQSAVKLVLDDCVTHLTLPLGQGLEWRTVSTLPSKRLLSIGEYAGATQLSPKALRLYDEHRLLVPARVDAANGYRYYGSDQVAAGRMIRCLRDMGLSLDEIASVLALQGAAAEMVLSQFARELERRYARERRAFHAALLLMRNPNRSDSPEILDTCREAITVAAREFMSNRHHFVETFHAEAQAMHSALARARIRALGAGYCSLIDPLSDEEARLEVAIPVEMLGQMPAGMSFRRLEAGPHAVLILDTRSVHASDLTAGLDALFDWFDRRGYRAIDAPLVSIEARSAGLHTEIAWAYAPAAISRS
jgi:DNA-binding transcriptional MerR regulator